MNHTTHAARRSLNLLLIAVGSHGDVHPFVGLGLRLRERGHRVTIVTNPCFQPIVERAGIGFLPLGTADEYWEMTADPDLWHPRKGFNTVARGVMKGIRQSYAHVVREYEREPADTVVVASSLGLGARVAQETMGVPLASVHLSPAVFTSLYDTPRLLPGLHLAPWMPRFIKRLLLHGVAHRLIVDNVLGKPLNAFRAELGLAPVKGVMMEWWHAPQLTLGLWPDWYAAPQPDWPRQAKLTGFPLFDERGMAPMPKKLVRFLDEGPPPIAFTPGSAMFQGRPFFEASAEACRLLGRRGVLLSLHHEHIPANLPPGVIHVSFAPFSELLPRCAALVHHGGIGTAAQALAAGVPQLIMPMAHDQPDNAERLRRLGVARSIVPKRYRGPRVARALGELIGSPEVAARCATLRERLCGAHPLEETCDLIERLGRPAPQVAVSDAVRAGGAR